jgi:hypothetical protein
LKTNMGNLMSNIGKLCIQAIMYGVENKNLRSYSHLPWSSYTTQVFCMHKMQELPKSIQTISHISWFQSKLHHWFLLKLMQHRVPSKLQANMLLYVRLSLMDLVAFACDFLYNNTTSEIEMKKITSCCRDFKEH